MGVATLIVSIVAAAGAIGAVIAARNALTKTDKTSKEQIALQSRLTAIEEERRSDEVAARAAELENRRMPPASAVHAWENSIGTEVTIFSVNLLAPCSRSNVPMDRGEIRIDRTMASCGRTFGGLMPADSGASLSRRNPW